jgi:hypothetical protein
LEATKNRETGKILAQKQYLASLESTGISFYQDK